jgi:superfamily II DNA or RNA helicase
MQSSSYNEFNNNKIWRGIKDIKFDLNYLINIINRETNENIEYLSIYKEFKPLLFNYNPVYANDYRVSNIYTYDDFKETKTAIIQSCTGTGKTTAIAKHMKEYISHDDTNIYKILSIFN